ncbi:MAG TPA: hypothetical protein VIZ69_00650 [Thermoanaerobaculia bacterium]
MKRIVLLIVVAGVAFAGWRTASRWRAKTAYEAFAEAWTHGNMADAKKYGTEECAKHALEERSLRGLESGQAMEAFRGTRYRYEKETVSDGGDLELEVHQTIFFDPPGITSAIGGAMYTGIQHSATLRNTPEGWRVIAFEPRYIDMGPLRRR